MGESSKRGSWADPGRQPERGVQMEAVKGEGYSTARLGKKGKRPKTRSPIIIR